MCPRAREENEDPCSFCDKLIALIESSFGGKHCPLGVKLMGILRENKDSLQSVLHHRKEDFKDVFESLEASPAETLAIISCKFCSQSDIPNLEKYLEHLNMHYIAISKMFQTYYAKSPMISKETPLVCPICSSPFGLSHDLDQIRSWASLHFYECGDPVRRERIHSLKKMSRFSQAAMKIIRCGWCESPFLHRSALKAHMEACIKRFKAGQQDKTNQRDMKLEALSKILLAFASDCETCRSYEDILSDANGIQRRFEFIKHVTYAHPVELDALELDQEQLAYIGDLLSTQEMPLTIHEPMETELSCIICPEHSPPIESLTELKIHLAQDHYKAQILLGLSSKTFPTACPLLGCPKALKQESEALEHLGITHGHLNYFMLNETSKPEIQKEAMSIFQTGFAKSQVSYSHKCPICPYSYSSNLGVLKHLCKHFRLELLEAAPLNGNASCDLSMDGSPCGLIFKNSYIHIIHLGITHGLLSGILARKGISYEELKKNKSPGGKESGGTVMGQCSRCKEIFASKENLLLHTCNSIFDKESRVSLGSRKRNLSKREHSALNNDYSDISEDEAIQPDFQCRLASCKLFFPSQDSLFNHYAETAHNV